MNTAALNATKPAPTPRLSSVRSWIVLSLLLGPWVIRTLTANAGNARALVARLPALLGADPALRAAAART